MKNIKEMLEVLKNKPEGATHLSADGSCFYKVEGGIQLWFDDFNECKWREVTPDFKMSDKFISEKLTPLTPEVIEQSNLINEYISKTWFEHVSEGNTITSLAMTESCQCALFNEPNSENTVKPTMCGIFLAGLLINDLEGDEKIFELTTREGVERYYVVDNCVSSELKGVFKTLEPIEVAINKADEIISEQKKMNGWIEQMVSLAKQAGVKGLDIECELNEHFSTGYELKPELVEFTLSKPMWDVMIDIETLGRGPNSVMWDLAGVFFNPETGEIGEQFHKQINLEDSMLYGDIDASTITWWMDQSYYARSAFKNGTKATLSEVLMEFDNWIQTFANHENVKIWGNGSTFDNIIVKNAYDKTGLTVPWKFWNDRDVRTIVDLGRRLKNINPKNDMEFVGTKHNALDDAIHQAKYVSEIYKALNNESDS